MKLTTTLFAMIMLAMSGCSEESTTNYFEIETPQGSMILRLYDETPQHRDNFMRLVDEGFYDGTTFHRVMQNFMIQGGDPNSKDDDPMNDGIGGPGYTVPAEFNPELIHKKGAIAAARMGDQANPEKASSGSQFYIVQGQVFESGMFDMIEQQAKQKYGNGFAYSEAAREAYTTVGGYPPLDMEYTVFGELVEGYDVLDRIADVQTSGSQGMPPNRPLTDVTMTIKRLSNYSPTQ